MCMYPRSVDGTSQDILIVYKLRSYHQYPILHAFLSSDLLIFAWICLYPYPSVFPCLYLSHPSPSSFYPSLFQRLFLSPPSPVISPAFPFLMGI